VSFRWIFFLSELIWVSKQLGKSFFRSAKLPGIKNLGSLIFIFMFCKFRTGSS